MMLKRLRIGRHDRGATAIEYGILASLIAVSIVAGAAATGTRTDAMLSSIAGLMRAGGSSSPAASMSAWESLYASYSEPAVGGNGIVPDIGGSLFGEGGMSWTLDQGGGAASYRIGYYGAVDGAYGNVWIETGVMEDGKLVASQRVYNPGNVFTRVQYLNQGGNYSTRVEMNATTGEVLRTETYDAGSNSWTVQP